MDSPDHTKPHILGIDPGLHGALALVRMVGGTPRVEVHDIPIHQVRINDGYRNRIDMDCAARWFVRHAPWIQCAIVEDVHAMPKDGPVQAFTFGYGVGVLHALCKAHGIPVQLVAPHTWKKKYGLNADKHKSRAVASRFFPHNASVWNRAKDDGRAEAALLGLLGFTEGWGA